ncbi:MAG: SRPBCC family protein [Nocardioides sp.]|uniref:SRPBCC family protein n=1 Tax=Nocardioides sp. TaxID=35761 RepID=UPI0039E579B6
MSEPLRVSASRAVPVSIEEAFDRVLPAPLPTIFSRRYAALPPIAATVGPDPWGTVGQSRSIQLTDRSSMSEELVAVERPHRFAYRLTDLTGPFKPLASSVDGEWSFAEVGTGTRITWSWTIHPTSRAASYALPAVGRLWRGYARQALEEVEKLLLG